jgi:hypothetical protein
MTDHLARSEPLRRNRPSGQGLDWQEPASELFVELDGPRNQAIEDIPADIRLNDVIRLDGGEIHGTSSRAIALRYPSTPRPA